MNNLVIVESPAKAKTIEGFLGSEFVVKSCYGHIRELPRKGDPIDIENNFNSLAEQGNAWYPWHQYWIWKDHPDADKCVSCDWKPQEKQHRLHHANLSSYLVYD